MTISKKLMTGQTSHFTKLVLFVVPLLLAMLSLACGAGSIIGDTTSLEVTASLSENDVNRLLRHSFIDQDEDNLLEDITGVDMQPGVIRIHGTYTNSDGATVPGSADITFSVQDGMLNGKITAVDIAGLDVNHPRVTRINDSMTREFAKAASESDKVEFTSVEITEDSLEFVIKVTPSQ
jgi:hypothetical protein